MAERGLRVLAVAVGKGAAEADLTLLGLVGIADPPRPEAMDAIARARRAGIRTVMITGDHPATALAIAREMGIVRGDEDPALVLHARVTAEEKIEIVRELKRQGEIVAMTGDGVNDAPALREAHIGIAMGQGGTEVTREASDMVLTDDNFATIVAAVEEGRGIYDNIRKTLVYLLAGNAGELGVMLSRIPAGPAPAAAPLAPPLDQPGDGRAPRPGPGDGPSDCPGVLDRPPRPPAEPMLGRSQWTRILWVGALEAGSRPDRLPGQAGERGRGPGAQPRLLDPRLLRALPRLRRPQPEPPLLAGRRVHEPPPRSLWWRLSVLVQVSIDHLAFARSFFRIEEMSTADTVLCLAVGLIPVTILELRKLIPRLRR